MPVELWPSRRALREGRTAAALLGHRALPSGEERWSLTTSTPLRDEAGEVHAVVTVFQDMTERRRSADRLEALAEAGAALGSSLDYNATLTAVARLVVPRLADWCIVHVAEEGAGVIQPLAVTHRDPEKMRWAREMQQRFPTFRDAPLGAAAVMRSGRAMLVPEVTDEMLEAAAIDADHLALLRTVGVRSFLAVPLNAQGRTVGSLSLLTAAESGRVYDPTDLATAELLGRRAGLAIENARLFREAQEANRLKDEFLATLSHELRTPLNAIVGWTEVLRQDLGIHRNAQAQAQLVSDLLDVSRITSGKLRLQVGAVDLARVVQAALDTVRPAAEAKSIELEPVLDSNAGEISGDPDRLQQVVWNLLANAVRHSPSGRAPLVTGSSLGDQVEIRVVDRGPGIPRADRDRVFAPFQRLGDTDNTTGVGLGLALARGLAEAMSGSLQPEDTPGGGLTMVVSLPVATVRPGDEPVPGSRERSASGPEVQG